ncbi:MAG TPA: hypothetical protein DDW76_27235 [Cyanobacteria bacterium UBA11369]|nr:hypothetical protein [Cyanobacteria bacterium UBA11369]
MATRTNQAPSHYRAVRENPVSKDRGFAVRLYSHKPSRQSATVVKQVSSVQDVKTYRPTGAGVDDRGSTVQDQDFARLWVKGLH